MNTLRVTHPSTRCIEPGMRADERKAIWFVVALLCLSLVASACAPAVPAASSEVSNPPTIAVQPTASPTQAPTQTTAPREPSVMLNPGELAQAVATLSLPAVQPKRTLLWLYGYPINAHAREPQIFLFAVKDLAVNGAAAQAAQDLQSLLQGQQAGKALPFLPPTTDVQQLHAQVKPLDFQNGKGVRYLTQYGNGLSPINNQHVFYTFQGLTNDGNYYVAAVLPVYLNGLPSYPTDTANLPQEFTSDYATYLQSITNQLNFQQASDYAPDLGRLDALIQSIEVK